MRRGPWCCERFIHSAGRVILHSWLPRILRVAIDATWRIAPEHAILSSVLTRKVVAGLSLAAAVVMGGACPQAFSQENAKIPTPAIVRLDGTRITAPQADAVVLRAMREARVPGLGVIIFNRGAI